MEVNHLKQRSMVKSSDDDSNCFIRDGGVMGASVDSNGIKNGVNLTRAGKCV